MNTAVESTTYTMIPVDRIVSRFRVRRLRPQGIARIKESMQRFGFQPQHPLLVARNDDGTYELLDGNHRLEAAIALGITMLPVHIIAEPLTDNDKKRLARQANATTEAMIPTTFVDDAELVWAEVDNEKTQVEIGEILGWSREKVKDYAALRKICVGAWGLIGATFEKIAPAEDDESAPKNGATAPMFTEGLLRSILDLESEQQLELVQSLAHPDKDKRITKGKFKTQAENYQARNKMRDYAKERIGDLGEEFTTRLLDEIYSGAYDNDWKNEDHPKLHKLIAAIRDEWERKNSIHLLPGDFYEEVKKVGDGSVDLILTDPPYNVANSRVFSLEGRSDISQDFGAWDKYGHEEFITLLDSWCAEWARILRDGGSGYVFVSYRYVSYLADALEKAGLRVREMIDWCKTNPAPQIQHTTFRSSVEHILYFTKGKDHTFHWQGDNDMHTYYIAPICQGNERLKDAKGDTLHPTQKPEQVIEHLMSTSSNWSDMVFDGFMGVGTTGAVAKRLGRKFIGIEQNKTFFEAAQRRIA